MSAFEKYDSFLARLNRLDADSEPDCLKAAHLIYRTKKGSQDGLQIFSDFLRQSEKYSLEFEARYWDKAANYYHGKRNSQDQRVSNDTLRQMTKLMSSCKSSKHSNYLRNIKEFSKKQIKKSGKFLAGVDAAGNTVIRQQCFSSDKLCGLELISVNGKKWQFKGGKKGYALIGCIRHQGTVYVCEGFATALTINLATDKPVIVCFGMGALVKGAEKAKKLMPKASIVIAADTGKQALDAAKKAAKIVSGQVVQPSFKAD